MINQQPPCNINAKKFMVRISLNKGSLYILICNREIEKTRIGCSPFEYLNGNWQVAKETKNIMHHY